MTQGERIKNLRKDRLNMTLEVFGKRLGVTKMTISRLENEVNNLTDQMCKSICREFNVSEAWLRDGVGEMFVEQPRDEMIQAFVDRALSEEPPGVRRWVLSMLTEFSDNWWDEIQDVLEKIKKKEIGPYAEPFAPAASSQADSYPPGSPESTAEAEALYESSSGIAPKRESAV